MYFYVRKVAIVMKKMTKIAALLLALATLAFCFAGCGQKPTDTEKTYKICSDNAFAPFEYWDKEANDGKGAYVGIDMDLLAAIAEDQGFKYTMDNIGFDAACGNVQSGQADAMIAGMTINDDRKEVYDFSDPYFNDGQIMCTSKDSGIDSLDDLNGKVIAAKTGTMGAKYAESVKDQYGFTIQYYEDSPTMYQTVINNKTVCFEDRSVAGEAIKSGVELVTVGETLNPSPYGFAVKKGKYPELIEMFNAGLKNIKANGKYEEILAKYGITANE